MFLFLVGFFFSRLYAQCDVSNAEKGIKSETWIRDNGT